MSNNRKKIVDVKNLSVHFMNKKSVNKAVDNVSMHVYKGEVVSIVGESGSGKTTLGRAVMSLVPHVSGSVVFNDRLMPSDPIERKKHNNSSWLARKMQMIFQDPYSSLHPSWNVYKIVSQGIKYNSPLIIEKQIYKITKDIYEWVIFFNLIDDKTNKNLAEKLLEDTKIAKLNFIDVVNRIKTQKNSSILIEKNKIKSYKSEIRENKDKKERLVVKIKELKTKIKEIKSANKAAEIQEIQNILKKIKEIKIKQVQMWSFDFPFPKEKDIDFDAGLQKIENDEKNKFQNKKLEFKNIFLESLSKIKENNSKSKETKEQIYNLKNKYKYDIFQLKINREVDILAKEKEFIEKYTCQVPRYVARQINKIEAKKFSYYNRKKYNYNVSSSFLNDVGLDRSFLSQLITDLSGGQRQRIAIARSLIMEPELVVADEPISALDVSMQSQVINMLNDMKDKYSLTIIFIAHDLRMVRYVSDRLYIMFKGKIVEKGEVEEVFKNPIHPYTKMLLSAIPSINNKTQKLKLYEYDLSQNLKERDKHSFISVSNNIEHFVLGTEEEVKVWKNDTKQFVKEFNYN